MESVQEGNTTANPKLNTTYIYIEGDFCDARFPRTGSFHSVQVMLSWFLLTLVSVHLLPGFPFYKPLLITTLKTNSESKFSI